MGPRLTALHDPEDVLQDVLVQALEHARPPDLRIAPQAWLGSLADHRILSLAAQARPRTRPRRETTLPASHVALDLEQLRATPAPTDPGARREARELAAERLRALARLSFEQRASLVLRGFCGLSWKTIGAILDRSDEAARRLHSRARRALQQEVGDLDDER